MIQTHCRHFNGYKPCQLSPDCSERCPHRDVPQVAILIVHLGALGAVARATSLLPAIKRKFPSSKVTWVTDAPGDQLLKFNPLVDRVLTTSFEDQLILRTLHFEIGLVVDKSLKAAGVLAGATCDMVYGFVANSRGGIEPATPASLELWTLGLDDHQKFHVNKKPETQLMVEALELGPFRRDEYQIHLSADEKMRSFERKLMWTLGEGTPVIGLNTGCASTIPYKKWTIQYHRQVICALLARGFQNIVLLGGKEDTQRNQEIGHGLPVILSNTEDGLRDGLVSTQACDLVITGDSLGMHMAIALKKFVIAWFGPTCAQEIDLYDRGVALQAAVPCGPCWKRSCEKNPMCYDQVDLKNVLDAVDKGAQWLCSTSKPHFSETSVSRPPL